MPAATQSASAPVETASPGRASSLSPPLANRSGWGLRPDYCWYGSYVADVRERPDGEARSSRSMRGERNFVCAR
ncbi:MAG: hypothetical protein OXI91_16650 [Chloroflexota bacterium]|nr:hypothetical protein [Chloroflexota bacterium]